MQDFLVFIDWVQFYCICIYTYTCTRTHITSSLSIHQLMDTGCLQILVIMKNASMNMEVQVFLEDCDFISFRHIFRSGIAESYCSVFLFFVGNSVLFSIVAVPIYIPKHSAQGFFLSTCYPVLMISCLFDNGHLTGVKWYFTMVLISRK